MDGDGTNYRCTDQPSILSVPLNKEMETDYKINSLCMFFCIVFHVGDVGEGRALWGPFQKSSFLHQAPGLGPPQSGSDKCLMTGQETCTPILYIP